MTRDDLEWTAAVASLAIREKVKIMPSRRQHEENDRDCRTIVQQLVSSIPHEVLTSTSYGRKEQGSSTRRKTVTFVDQDKEDEKLGQKKLEDCLSGETKDEKIQRVQDQHPGQESLSGETAIDEKFPDEKQDLGNKVLSGGSDGCKEGTDMIWRSVQTPSQPLQQMTIPERPIQTGTRARDQNSPN